MNAYERRRKIRELKQKNLKNKKLLAKLLRQHHLMDEFERAFEDLYAVTPTVTLRGGWYTVKAFNTAKYREDDLVNKTRIMQSLMHEQELKNEGTELQRRILSYAFP